MSAAFYASYAALWLLLLVVTASVFVLYRHFGLMALGTAEGVERDGLKIGEVAPTLSAVTPEGATINWTPSPERSALLFFGAPDCGPCEEVLPFVSRLAHSLPANGDLEVVTVVIGTKENADEFARMYDLPSLTLAEDGSGASDVYHVRVTPFAFVIGADRRILSKGLCSDPMRLRRVLDLGGLENEAAVLDPSIEEARRAAAAERAAEAKRRLKGVVA
jgi:thiol-disulfide isomerase/thioredoxin